MWRVRHALPANVCPTVLLFVPSDQKEYFSLFEKAELGVVGENK